MTNAAEYPARVREAFPEAKLSVQSFRDRTVLVVEPADLHDILQHLKDHQGFEFLVDVTAVDYDGYPTPQPGRFGVLWILRNFEAEADLVVKTYLDPSLPTTAGATKLNTAKEVYKTPSVQYPSDPWREVWNVWATKKAKKSAKKPPLN